MFRFGKELGAIEAIIRSHGLPIEFAAPAVWKRELRLTRLKDLSREAAVKLWPDWSDRMERKKDDGRAEAALLAFWAFKRKMCGRTSKNEDQRWKSREAGL